MRSILLSWSRCLGKHFRNGSDDPIIHDETENGVARLMAASSASRSTADQMSSGRRREFLLPRARARELGAKTQIWIPS
jgi:hypothetical protein